MEISFSANLNGAKPFVSYAKSHCHFRPQNFVSMSCRAIETEPTNFYKLLSLSSSNAGIDEIKRAYRTMALKYHPDVCHSSTKEESAKMFVQLNEAYKVLSNPVSREEYDYRLNFGDISAQNYKVEVSDVRVGRKRWEGQIVELRRRANYRAAHKDGSWGSRMRARK